MNTTKHMFRFLGAPDTPPHTWRLTDADMHHAKTVLRLKAGDRVEVFDGQGLTGIGHLAPAGPYVCEVALSTDRIAHPCIAIALEVLRQDTLEELLPILIELGAIHIHLFLHKQSPKKIFSSTAQERYQRIMLAATKQSKQVLLARIHTWPSLNHFLLSTKHLFDTRILLSEHGCNPLTLNLCTITPPDRTVCICGSEAGFTDEHHQDLAASEAIPLALSPFIMKTRHALPLGLALLNFMIAVTHP